MKPRTAILIISALFAAAILAILFARWIAERGADRAFDAAAQDKYKRAGSTFDRSDTVGLGAL